MKRVSLVILACFVAGMVLVGCGKKEWPQPKAYSERFSWNAVAGFMADEQCLTVEAVLGGKWKNVDAVVLELSEAEGPTQCPDCPFSPTERVAFKPGDPRLTMKGPKISLAYCPEVKSERYRWRLIGKNTVQGLPDELSSVLFTGMNQ